MTRLSGKSLRSRQSDPPVNPMDSVSNLADAMLVLAVGIMLALIINWNVDITAPKTEQPAAPVPFDESELTEAPDGAEVVEGGELQEMGTVYYDAENNTYYIVQK